MGKLFVKTGVIFGLISSVLAAFPTGHLAVKNVVKHQTGLPLQRWKVFLKLKKVDPKLY